LALGTLEPRKNIAALVRAFGALPDSGTGIRLVVAGPDGADRPAVERAIAALPRERGDRVVVTGAVSDAERASLLERATVLAYPSLDEGFGFPVLEAMAAGVPVVATRAGSVPEVAGDAAILVDPSDAAALAAAI